MQWILLLVSKIVHHITLNTNINVLNFQDLSGNDWEVLKAKNPAWNEVDLRDNRYDQIIHMVNYNSDITI